MMLISKQLQKEGNIIVLALNKSIVSNKWEMFHTSPLRVHSPSHTEQLTKYDSVIGHFKLFVEKQLVTEEFFDSFPSGSQSTIIDNACLFEFSVAFSLNMLHKNF